VSRAVARAINWTPAKLRASCEAQSSLEYPITALRKLTTAEVGVWRRIMWASTFRQVSGHIASVAPNRSHANKARV
jgi:hypothetical protein